MRLARLAAAIVFLPALAAAQGHSGHTSGGMTKAQLAQHCAAMRADQQRGTLADTPDAKAMMDQCDKLDKQSGQAQHHR